MTTSWKFEVCGPVLPPPPWACCTSETRLMVRVQFCPVAALGV
ncbi:hypothetical protein ACVWW3_001371 [Bradyrhizobium sp. LM2.9]